MRELGLALLLLLIDWRTKSAGDEANASQEISSVEKRMKAKACSADTWVVLESETHTEFDAPSCLRRDRLAERWRQNGTAVVFVWFRRFEARALNIRVRE